MRNKGRNKGKKIVAMVMMACMLLTVTTVSSGNKYGIMPCGNELSKLEELN